MGPVRKVELEEETLLTRPLRGAGPTLYLVEVSPASDSSLGALLRDLRLRPRLELPKGMSMAEAARRTGLYGPEAVSDSFWLQVEQGKSNASETVLLRMALAVDARPHEIAQLFHLAGYGLVHDKLVAIGAQTAQVSYYGAEAGILTDPRLPHDKRRVLLDHLQDILEAQDARESIAASDPAPYEQPRAGNGPGQ